MSDAVRLKAPGLGAPSSTEGEARELAHIDSSHAGAPLDLTSFYRATDFFVARSPLLPLSQLRAWGTQARQSYGHDGSAGWAERRQALVSELRRQLEAPALRAALFFASPSVARLLVASDRQALPPANLLRTLARYLFRACGRETPFGLFAGVSIGAPGEVDRFELQPREKYRAFTRVSASWLRDTMSALAARPGIRQHVPHRPSSTLALVQGNYRCVVSRKQVGQERLVRAVFELEFSPALEQIVQLTRDGLPPAELAKALEADDFKASAVLPFIEQLLELRVLEPTWLPTATGVGGLANAIAQLSTLVQLSEEAEQLRAVASELREADRAPLGVATARYEHATKRLRQLSGAEQPDLPLQTELLKPAQQLTVSDGTLRLLLEAATLVQNTGRVAPDLELTDFSTRFVARYEGRLVPLAEALDRDVGIGFGPTDSYAEDALLVDLPFSPRPHATPASDGLDAIRHRLLYEALAGSKTTCELDDQVLAELARGASAPRLPESLAVMAGLARDDAGKTLVVAPMVLAVAAMLGRFCESEPQLAEALRRHVAAEQELAPDVVLADVAYFPLDSTANIVVRPPLLGHEIPYFSHSGALREQQLSLEDLFVGVEEGSVRLYSARLGKRVGVRIANAHNFDLTTSPPVYRFLGALQRQDTALVPAWSWGELEAAAFLPRLTRGSTVLSLARWQLPLDALTSAAKLPGAEAFDAVQRLRARLALPRWLTRFEGDQKMVVDLDNELSVEELLHDVPGRSSLAVEELFPGPDEVVLQGQEGGFAAQFIVPFLRKQAESERPMPPGLGGSEAIAERRYSPGSGWLYAKIYAPRLHLPQVLRLLRAQVVEPSLGSSVMRWFYLPFADPDPHLRLRLQGPPHRLRTTVLARLERALQPLMKSGRVWRWELSTYEQELERYGGASHIDLAEDVFCADSEAACALLGLCEGQSEPKWQVALLGIDRLLADCGLALEERASLAHAAAANYAQELGANAQTRHALGAKYRKYSSRIAELLWQSPTTKDECFHEILAFRSQQLAPTWSEYRRRERAGSLPCTVAELVQSFSHLHAIRVLGAEARAHELVLFEFLRRQYLSRIAQISRSAGPVGS